MPSLDPQLIQQAAQFFGVLDGSGNVSNDNANRIAQALAENPGLMDAITTGEGFASAGGADLPPGALGGVEGAPAAGPAQGTDILTNAGPAGGIPLPVPAAVPAGPAAAGAGAQGVGAGIDASGAGVPAGGNTFGAGANVPPGAEQFIDPSMIAALVGQGAGGPPEMPVEPAGPAFPQGGAGGVETGLTGANLNFGTLGNPITPTQLIGKVGNSALEAGQSFDRINPGSPTSGIAELATHPLIQQILQRILGASSQEQTLGRGNPRGLGAGQ